MPIFSKSKSASLNPDKLANKKVYERDKARVNSGTPSASSKVDADTFSSLTDTLEELKNELIKITDLTTNYSVVGAGNLTFGNILNIISKIKKVVIKIKSGSITTTEQNKLQEYADDIVKLFTPLNDDADYEDNEVQNDLSASRGQYTPAINIRVRLSQFLKQIIVPLKDLIQILNSKLVSSGTDANRNVPVEISGINAPVPYNDFTITGAGFKTSWKLEKGAEQYQNQKYI